MCSGLIDPAGEFVVSVTLCEFRFRSELTLLVESAMLPAEIR